MCTPRKAMAIEQYSVGKVSPNPQPIPPSTSPNPAPQSDQSSPKSSSDYPQICLTTISPYISNHGNLDVVVVLRMAIEACNKQINATIVLAKGQLESKGIDADGLKICEDEYKDASDNLKNAMPAVKTRDIGTLQSMLSAVIADVTTCTDEMNGKKSALEAHDKMISNMASNCLAIASLVKMN
ncbi:hypothetical protein L6164_011980 [Bauhinia variegata]|uniref:Uncharacterized protein n=1 Tax=Bauhinia variegata TaxID=167791 RepID=A0ACB9PBH5_BAUVA|nr:hypothetical protein L6164_011980 [Bauhinia variegata]